MKVKMKRNAFSLHNTQLFHADLNASAGEILRSFLSLCMEHNCNQIHSITTLIHSFSFLLFYTKNLQLTIHYVKESMDEYFNYLSQINNLFQFDGYQVTACTPRDAAIVAYKKSIFDIPLEWRKKMPDLSANDQQIFQHLNIFMDEVKQLVCQMPLEKQNQSS